MLAQIMRGAVVGVGLVAESLNLSSVFYVGLAFSLTWMILIFFIQEFTNIKSKKKKCKRGGYLQHYRPDLPMIEYKEVKS